jgi:hypothetical protein
VDDVFHPGLLEFYVSLPTKGKTYTIRGIAPGQDGTSARNPEIAVYLQEIVNPKSSTPPYRERGFKSERFAPLDELPEEQEEVRVGQFVPALL